MVKIQGSDSNNMKVMLLTQFGEHLQPAILPRPEAAAGQVLVRIQAAGLNPLDIKIRNGKGGHAGQQPPAVLGLDLAGTVEAVGEGVTKFKTGDEVYGMVGGVGGIQGTLAEYAAVDADLLAHKPGNLSMREAAALPLVFITAWEGLKDKAYVQPGQKVLVHGGAGGVGYMAVQLALASGAQVYATVGAAKAAYVQQLGATAIDYINTKAADYNTTYTQGEGFDIIYDTVGGETLADSFTIVKYNTGQVVSALGRGPYDLSPLAFRGGTFSAVFTLLPMLTGKGRGHHGYILQEAAKLVAAGKLKPLLNERRFTLVQVNEAYALLEEGEAVGKLVVEIGQ